MAGKSNKSKNKVKASNSTTPDIPIHEPKTADTLITSKDETPDASAPSSSSVDNLSATKPADPSLVSNNLVGENAKSVEETQPPNRNQAESIFLSLSIKLFTFLLLCIDILHLYLDAQVSFVCILCLSNHKLGKSLNCRY